MVISKGEISGFAIAAAASIRNALGLAELSRPLQMPASKLIFECTSEVTSAPPASIDMCRDYLGDARLPWPSRWTTRKAHRFHYVELERRFGSSSELPDCSFFLRLSFLLLTSRHEDLIACDLSCILNNAGSSTSLIWNNPGRLGSANPAAGFSGMVTSMLKPC